MSTTKMWNLHEFTIFYQEKLWSQHLSTKPHARAFPGLRVPVVSNCPSLHRRPLGVAKQMEIYWWSLDWFHGTLNGQAWETWLCHVIHLSVVVTVGYCHIMFTQLAPACTPHMREHPTSQREKAQVDLWTPKSTKINPEFANTIGP